MRRSRGELLEVFPIEDELKRKESDGRDQNQAEDRADNLRERGRPPRARHHRETRRAESQLIAWPQPLLGLEAFPIDEGAVGRAEIANEVAAARAPNLGMMTRHALVREDEVIVLGGADADSAGEALFDRGEGMGADQPGYCRPGRFADRWRF